MTPGELSTVWVPVPLRWRHVIPGDVFVGKDDRLWQVTDLTHDRGMLIEVTCQSVLDVFYDEADPDDTVNVLVPVLERDAVELTIEELGARLVSRRNEE